MNATAFLESWYLPNWSYFWPLYNIQSFITIFTGDHQFKDRRIQSTNSQPTFVTPIFIWFSHVKLGLPVGLLARGFLTKIWHFTYLMCTKCSAHLTWFRVSSVWFGVSWSLAWSVVELRRMCCELLSKGKIKGCYLEDYLGWEILMAWRV